MRPGAAMVLLIALCACGAGGGAVDGGGGGGDGGGGTGADAAYPGTGDDLDSAVGCPGVYNPDQAAARTARRAARCSQSTWRGGFTAIEAEIDRAVSVAGPYLESDPFIGGSAASAGASLKSWWSDRHAEVDAQVAAH